jgi:hypothetical protein
MLCLSQIARLGGRLDDAEECCTQTLTIWIQMASPWVLCIGLIEMAAIRLAQGRVEAAVTLLGSIEGIVTHATIALPPRWQPHYDRLMAAAQDAMDPEAFGRAFDAGRRLDARGAVSFALSG